MQWTIPVATAAWAIWTWAHDHERERRFIPHACAKILGLYSDLT